MSSPAPQGPGGGFFPLYGRHPGPIGRRRVSDEEAGEDWEARRLLMRFPALWDLPGDDLVALCKPVLAADAGWEQLIVAPMIGLDRERECFVVWEERLHWAPGVHIPSVMIGTGVGKVVARRLRPAVVYANRRIDNLLLGGWQPAAGYSGETRYRPRRVLEELAWKCVCHRRRQSHQDPLAG